MAALLFVAVGLVLLVACVNLAAFLLSRGVDRRKEMAVRVAMGAGRLAIVRQLLVESLLLASIGAVLGLALGRLAMAVLVGIELPLPVPLELEIAFNWRLLFFTGVATAGAAVLFGLAPALAAAKTPAAATLRDEAGSSGGKRKIGARGVLVVSQMALSTILLFGAGLFVRSLQSAADMDLGFATRAGAVVKVETVANEYTSDERLAFVNEIETRLETNPQIEAHGITVRMPLNLGTIIFPVDVPGVEPPPGQNRHRPEATSITPGYFDAMGIPILDGRDFESSDDETSQNVIIISREASERWWPAESAVGKVVYRNGDTEDPRVVVGVVGDVKIWSLGEPPRTYIYWPFQQDGANGSFYITARGTTPPGELAAFIRTEARSIDPEIFLTSVGTMDDHLGYIYFLPRMVAAMLSLVGGLALLLACIGLYGMVSYGVSRRTREMGIRLALGADRQSVVQLVLKGGLTLVAVGGAAGIVVSLGLGRLVERFLVGVGGLDLLALLAAPLVLGLVAVTATYVPARRASKVNPVEALRSE